MAARRADLRVFGWPKARKIESLGDQGCAFSATGETPGAFSNLPNCEKFLFQPFYSEFEIPELRKQAMFYRV